MDSVSIVSRIQNYKTAKEKQVNRTQKTINTVIASAQFEMSSPAVTPEPVEVLPLDNNFALEEDLKTVIVLNMPDLTERLTPPNRMRKEVLPQEDLLAAASDSATSPGFKLLDYSLEQLNNVVHGNKIAPPKNSKELLPEPIELAYDRVTSFFRSNKNN
jgi:hypothetical protein